MGICKENFDKCVRQPKSADGKQLCWDFAYVEKPVQIVKIKKNTLATK